MPLLRVLICLLFVAATASSGQAGVLRIAPESQLVDSGGLFTLRLFFEEETGDFDQTETGLLAAAARILVDASQSGLVTVESIESGPDFDVPGATYLPSTGFPFAPPAGFFNLVGLQIGALPPPATPIGGEILLAEFEMRVVAPLGTEVFFFPATLGNPSDGFDSLVGSRGTVYDKDFIEYPVSSVTVAGVVPEPGSMLIWAGLVGAPLLVGSRRRKLVAKA